MDIFEVRVKLANPAAPERTEEVSLPVDGRATISWVPCEVVEALGVARLSRLPFRLPDGRTTEREVGAVMVEFDGRRTGATVAFAEPGDKAALGMTSLESLGFTVDPVAKKLVPHDLRAGNSIRAVEPIPA